MKENNRYSWMKAHAPLGFPIEKEVSAWVFCMVASTFWCMRFFIRYLDYRGQLFEIRGGRKVLLENAKMPDFEYLTNNLFEIFGVVILFCVLAIVYHYYYHGQGSKMMYLMRRLPSKWELHIRCVTLPVLASVVTVIYMLVLRMLFYAIYLFCTPAQCLVI
jgi:hypothetical protein